MDSSPRVLVFCRYPEPGAVKTRLAQSIGPTSACALYRAFVRDVLDALEEAGARTTICAAPDRSLSAYAAWLGSRYRLQHQQGGDLGARMANAFARAFNNGSQRALLLGTDVPQLPPGVVRRAWSALQEAHLALGPAVDGGYYLIGLRCDSFSEELFQGVSWSTRHVLQQTISRLPRGRRHALLPALRDCDELNDLPQLLHQAPPERARATRRQALELGVLRKA